MALAGVDVGVASASSGVTVPAFTGAGSTAGLDMGVASGLSGATVPADSGVGRAATVGVGVGAGTMEGVAWGVSGPT